MSKWNQFKLSEMCFMVIGTMRSCPGHSCNTYLCASPKYVAAFAEDIKKAVQYGNEVKAESICMSVSQLVPLARVEDYFNDQVGLPISKGSIDNFKNNACEKLEKIGFKEWAKNELLNSPVDHADETGININGKKAWPQNLSNDKVTLYHSDEKRGQEAMNRMGILPYYKEPLCHDAEQN